MGYLLLAAAPDLGRGVTPLVTAPDLGCRVTPLVAAPDLGRWVSPLGRSPQPPTRGSSSRPFLRRCSLVLSAAAPDLGRGVAPLGLRSSGMGSSQVLPLTSDVGWLISATLWRARRSCLRFGVPVNMVNTK